MLKYARQMLMQLTESLVRKSLTVIIIARRDCIITPVNR